MPQTSFPLRSSALAARPSDPDLLPRRVGQWDLTARVAKGRLANVYRVRPAEGAPDCPALYALKTLRPQWEDDPQAIRLLLREAVAGRSVSHPHVISILTASISRTPRFVVMPCLEGMNLRRQLAAGQPLDLPESLWIVRQVAEALEALHAAGWMHGDVKPENIFISPEGHVTLLDLGFARRNDDITWAADRCVTGTCNYLAPEMIISAIRPDIRSDIYSLGVTLFELLSGRLPFAGRDLAELATQHREANPLDIRRLAPQIPVEVVGLVRQMISKDPLRRPQTPREVFERLTALEIATFSERAYA